MILLAAKDPETGSAIDEGSQDVRIDKERRESEREREREREEEN